MPGNEFSFRFPALFLRAILFSSGGSKIFLGRKKEMGLVAMRFVVRKMHAVYDGIS
jgi:hypothetical protein